MSQRGSFWLVRRPFVETSPNSTSCSAEGGHTEELTRWQGLAENSRSNSVIQYVRSLIAGFLSWGPWPAGHSLEYVALLMRESAAPVSTSICSWTPSIVTVALTGATLSASTKNML